MNGPTERPFTFPRTYFAFLFCVPKILIVRVLKAQKETQGSTEFQAEDVEVATRTKSWLSTKEKIGIEATKFWKVKISSKNFVSTMSKSRNFRFQQFEFKECSVQSNFDNFAILAIQVKIFNLKIHVSFAFDVPALTLTKTKNVPVRLFFDFLLI